MVSVEELVPEKKKFNQKEKLNKNKKIIKSKNKIIETAQRKIAFIHNLYKNILQFLKNNFYFNKINFLMSYYNIR